MRTGIKIVGVCVVRVRPPRLHGTLMRARMVSCWISSQTWMNAWVSSCGGGGGWDGGQQHQWLHHPESADSLTTQQAKHFQAPDFYLEHFNLKLQHTVYIYLYNPHKQWEMKVVILAKSFPSFLPARGPIS